MGDIDSLNIKPPQARILDHRAKKREADKSHHRRSDKSDKHRDERHTHREKHHRLVLQPILKFTT